MTTGGAIGAETSLQLSDARRWSMPGRLLLLKVNKNAIVLVHGGPVSSPEDADYVLKNTENCHGFYGASSMERLPTEVALTEQTKKFKQIGRS